MDEEGITDEMKDIYDEKCELEISSNLPYRNETQKKLNFDKDGYCETTWKNCFLFSNHLTFW